MNPIAQHNNKKFIIYVPQTTEKSNVVHSVS